MGPQPDRLGAPGDTGAVTTDNLAAQLRPMNAQVSARNYISAMWARRHFAVAMPMEEIRAAHQDTILGNVWHLVSPLLTTAVYYLIFGVILNVDRVENFILWLTVGVFAFRLTQHSVVAGAKALTSNKGLMRSIRFPRALLPTSVIVSELLTFPIQLCIVAIIAVSPLGVGISPRWFALPAVILLHTVFNLGVAFITARLNERFQDIQEVIPFIFRLASYASAVMFPIQRYIGEAGDGGVLEWLVLHNPLLIILQTYRWVFLGLPVPLSGLLGTIGVSVAVLVLGFQFFRGAETRYGRS